MSAASIGVLRASMEHRAEQKASLRVQALNTSATAVGGMVISSVERRRAFQKFLLRTSEGIEFFVHAPLYPVISYGDMLSVRCTRMDVSHRPLCMYPRIEIHRQRAQKGLGNVFLRTREFFIDAIHHYLPHPFAGLVAGVLVGGHVGFSQDIVENFRVAGLSHILAVSGYNVSIVAGALASFVRFFIHSRRWQFCIVGFGILFFVFLSGGSSATLRAGIMGLVVLCAPLAGRPYHSFNALLLAASILAFAQPSLIIFDVGFQLSFLATYAILFYAPTIAQQSVWIANRALRDLWSQTLAAYVFTVPLVTVVFGSLSFIAPLANLFVVPLIPPLMVGGFAWSIAASGGMLAASWTSAADALITFLGFPVWFLSWCVLSGAQIFATIPFAQQSIPSEGLAVPVVAGSIYGLLFAFTLKYALSPRAPLPDKEQ